jgi:hypothetical protein
VITEVIGISHITTKQDYSRWTRAHADIPGVKWSTFAGPGGTMIIVEYAQERRCLTEVHVTPESVVEAAEAAVVAADAVPAASSVQRDDVVRVSA